MAKKYKEFKHFASHVAKHDDLTGVIEGAAKKAKWAGYGVALGAIESIVTEGKTSKKVVKRHKQTVKALHKLARHAGGEKAVVPPLEKTKKAKKRSTAAVAAQIQEIEALSAAANAEPRELPSDQVLRTDNVVALNLIGQLDEKARPARLNGPRDGAADDLKMIAGIGPVLEETLHELGVFHFDQIAAWTAQEVSWVDEHLRFSGRITREDWIAQAAALAKGGRDEYVRVFGKEPR